MSAVFLNTDLTLKATFDLQPLVGALWILGLVLIGDDVKVSSVWTATLESNLVRPSLETSADELLTAVENLRALDRVAWQQCIVRLFDVGFQASYDTFELAIQVGNPLVTRIASVGASLGLSIYQG